MLSDLLSPLRRGAAALALCLVPAPSPAAPFDCPGGGVIVLADTPTQARATCTAAAHGLATLAACNVPLPGPVTVELRRTLSPGCLGIYHCGEDRIELLTPEAMDPARSPESSLAFVKAADYFASVLTHELAHAAFDAVPCPFDSCLATHEYVAHVMQVMSLPAPDIARFEAALDMSTPLSREAINPFVYLMAPDAFLRRAWVHLRQRPDACGFVGDIMQGRVIFDRERFE